MSENEALSLKINSFCSCVVVYPEVGFLSGLTVRFNKISLSFRIAMKLETHYWASTLLFN